MAAKITCPKCMAVCSPADGEAGSMRCKQCGTVFAAEPQQPGASKAFPIVLIVVVVLGILAVPGLLIGGAAAFFLLFARANVAEMEAVEQARAHEAVAREAVQQKANEAPAPDGW